MTAEPTCMSGYGDELIMCWHVVLNGQTKVRHKGDSAANTTLQSIHTDNNTQYAATG